MNPAPAALPVVPLAPGTWLGLLGGGQLGRMFCMAAQRLGYKVCVLDPATDSPAGSIAERHLHADYLDEAALAELGELCGAVTTEFENVPARALQRLGEHCRVAPGAAAVSVAQDRIAEKSFLARHGAEVTPWTQVHRVADLHAASAELFPGILKVARLGYDGKGQARVGTREEAVVAFEGFGGVPCVLEKRLALDLELSAIVARGFDGRSVLYPVCENLHANGILARTTVPARVSQDVAARAASVAQRVADALQYTGVLCVEFFLLASGALLANEMAPRPHNSGHFSIDACVTSQFEQQVRILAGLPLGSPQPMRSAVMLNLLGDAWRGRSGEPDWASVLAHPGAKLHLYGKSAVRPGRKMGHVTVLADSLEEASHTASQIASTLGIEA